MSSTPIADHAFLSDRHSCALIDRAGSVEWLCFPRFDGPSVFARLLDDDAGHWQVAPVADWTATRRYTGRSLALETTFRTGDGELVLTDALGLGPDNGGHRLGRDVPHVLVRRLTCTSGAVDVVVVGGGPAGEVVAGRCADRGLDTVLVERELVGGECSYWGCIPSKTLIRPGDVRAATRRAPGAASSLGPVDVPAVLARRDYMTSSWNDRGQEDWLADHRIRLLRGVGRLAGPRRVVVDGATTVSVRHAVVLATGSRAALPPVPGLAEVRPWDNRSATPSPRTSGARPSSPICSTEPWRRGSPGVRSTRPPRARGRSWCT